MYLINFCKTVFCVIFASCIFGCSEEDFTNPHKDDPPYISSQYDMQFSLTNHESVDTIVYFNKQVIIYNPYKYIGKLRLKGSMHNHTTNSDGFYSPIDAATKIRDEGKFDFYTITDHNLVTLDPMIDGIIWMGKSLEDTKGVQDHGQHLCIYNLPTSFVDYYKSDNMNELITKYSSAGAIVNYAHPDWWWQVQPSEKISEIKRVRFVEVLNSGMSGSERAYNILLSKFGVGVYGFGVDDFHNNAGFNKSWIVAFADKKEKNNIWNALLRGSFYASKNGGEMDVNCINGVIHVSTSEGAVISFIGKNFANNELGQVLLKKENTDKATYEIIGDEGYVYVKVQNGISTAISQAIVILNAIPISE